MVLTRIGGYVTGKTKANVRGKVYVVVRTMEGQRIFMKRSERELEA